MMMMVQMTRQERFYQIDHILSIQNRKTVPEHRAYVRKILRNIETGVGRGVGGGVPQNFGYIRHFEQIFAYLREMLV